MGTRRRPTVGLLLDGLEEEYQAIILSGASDAASERHADLICFAGGLLDAPFGFEAQRNVVYDLASAEVLDGLVILGSIGNYITAEAMRSFCQKYRSLSIVSAVIALEGHPAVLVDNEQGLRDAILHLIEGHRRRIAFIGGPEHNEDAQERYQTYVNVLTEYGLPVDPDLVARGDFMTRSGGEAAHLLLERSQGALDAIVAANDHMAAGAVEALRERGVNLPDDVAVVGFDDTGFARDLIPPLTTVRQPIYELGRTAASMVFDVLAGETVPERVKLPAELVIRRSCGCYYRTVPYTLEAKSAQLVFPDETQEPEMVPWRTRVISELIQAAGELQFNQQDASSWSARLVDAFCADLEGDSKATAFLQVLEEILHCTPREGGSPAIWHRALDVFLSNLIRYFDDHERLVRGAHLYQQGGILISEIAQQVQRSRTSSTRPWAWQLDRVSQMLVNTFDIEELTETIAQELPRLGIRQCYVCLYEDPLDPTGWARLILGYDENGRIEREGEKRFPVRRLVPWGSLARTEPRRFLVEALHSRDERFGFAVFEVGPVDEVFYKTLRVQIGAALKGVKLFRERRRAERELERSNEELGQFAYVASHDLQEPLRTVTSYLHLLKRRYGGQLDEAADEFIEFAVDGASRMQQLIDALLTYSRIGIKGGSPVPTASEKALNQALLNLQVAIEEKRAIIACDELPVVMADELQLAQLFQNLVGNAIKFHGEDVKPEVHVGARREGHMWQFCVRDNGIGIEPRHFDHLFELFRRLHARDEYPGTGIGLAVCKRIVDRHGGEIWVESEPGLGSTFFFTLPAIPR